MSAVGRASEFSEKMLDRCTLLYNCNSAIVGKGFEVPKTVMFYFGL